MKDSRQSVQKRQQMPGTGREGEDTARGFNARTASRTSDRQGPSEPVNQLIADSPRVGAQRKVFETIVGSPQVAAERARLTNLTEAVQRAADSRASTTPLQREAAPSAANRGGLPDNLKTGIESLSGMSMDDVKVHYGSPQPAQLNALAYAKGSDIYLGPGQEHHLPHEAWHVVQQRQGRVRATTQVRGVGINDDPKLESEADANGRKALQMANGKHSPRTAAEPAATGTPQLKNGKGKGGTAAKQEQEWKNKIVEHGFKESEVQVAGMGSANADITARDSDRLWLFEVKGANNWLSQSNIEHEGNVPAKQLGNKLLGKLGTTVKTPDSYADDEPRSVALDEVLKDRQQYPQGNNQLLLGASNLDINDALLGLQYDTGNDKFLAGKGAALPLSIASVLNYLLNATFDKKQDEEHYKSHYKRDIEEIRDAWAEWQGDGRSFLTHSPAYVKTLEDAYSLVRKTGSAHALHGNNLPKLKDDHEFRFVPVVRDLTNVEKPAQLKASPVGSAHAIQLVPDVVQRRKFKSVEEAKNYLLQHLPGPIDKNDYAAMTALLNGDLADEQDEFSNYNLLYQAYEQLENEGDVEDVVSARGLVKRRELSGAIWTHIAKGEVTANGVVGYHWKGLGEASVAVAVGAKTELGNGVYKQSVEARDNGPSNQKKKAKTNQSTFFPDSWSERDIRMAIEYAVQDVKTSPVLTVTIPRKGRGMRLFFNGKSYFPQVED